MFGWGPATRIWLAAGTTDLRKGFEGLYGLAREKMQSDPLAGHVFVFANAQRTRQKMLFWDGSGLWVCAKRLEKGRFRWPEMAEGEEKAAASSAELLLLLEGLDWTATERRRWYRGGTREDEEKSASVTRKQYLSIRHSRVSL